MDTLIGTDDLLHQELQNALLAAYIKRISNRPWGARIYRKGSNIQIDLNDGVSDQARISDLPTPSTTCWNRLTLSLQDAQALHEELQALEARYEARSIAGETPYILRLALAPIPE